MTYDFTKLTYAYMSYKLPVDVMGEIVAMVELLPSIEADLCRPWTPLLLASDVSLSFGLGLCYARLGAEIARSVEMTILTAGVFVRSQHSPEDDLSASVVESVIAYLCRSSLSKR